MKLEEVKIGTVGTLGVGSDTYAMVVVGKPSPKRILVAHMRDDDYRNYKLGRIDGQIMAESGRYGEDAGYYAPSVFSLRKNGGWYLKGTSSKYTGAFWPGEAENYRDPNF